MAAMDLSLMTIVICAIRASSDRLGQGLVDTLVYGLLGVVLQGLRKRESHIVQARGRIAMGVGHQLHEQHAVKKVERFGHAHARSGQAVQRIHFGALPGGFLFLPPELAALGHGPGRARVFDLAVFGVVHRLAKTAVRGFFVDLGAAGFVAAAHHEHHGLFATHELAHHGVDQPLFHEGLQSGRSLHPGRCKAQSLLPSGSRK